MERGASRVIQTKGDDNVFTERLQHTPFTIMPAIRLLLLWATYPLEVEGADLESVITIFSQNRLKVCCVRNGSRTGYT